MSGKTNGFRIEMKLALGAVMLCSAYSAGAAFVSPADLPPERNSAAVFEKREVNAEAVKRAVWKVTGQGVFEAYVNGRRVGDDFLKPGFTESGKCRHVYSYDVTELLDCAKGATNVMSAVVAAGWWCDAMMAPVRETPWQLGKKIAFCGRLEVEYAGGMRDVRETDASWLAAYAGPVVSAGIYEGETYDARRKVEGLKPVEVNLEFSGELRPAAAKVTLREDLALKPREIYVVKGAEGASDEAFGVARVVRRCEDGAGVRLEPGEMLVVDFGQNCSAVPSFDVAGEAGAELEIRTSEMLNESHGEKSRGNDGPAGTPYLASLRSAYAGIRYTLREGPQSYMPRHTYFGYRYVGATSTKPVVFTRWLSTPVSSVTKELERGSLVTGNAKVNRLVENIRWGMLSNYLSSPTDCPQRDERLGWTADTQVFMQSAAYLADTREFLGKFLADLRDAQRPDGCYQCFVPNVRHVFRPWASAGWTDAGVIMPYRLWKWYGDRRFVDESWDSMVRYMDFLEGNEEPYRINHGDWLAFEHHVKQANNLSGDAMDKRQVKALNAYFRVWVAMLMREMAAATGRDAAERHYAEEEAKLRRAFAEAYVGPDGTIKDEYKGQCNDLYMLKLGLCGGAAAVEATKRDLVDNIKSHGNRLQTGFLGTAILLPTLTFEAGAPELAYSLLLQEEFPSWLYSVNQGATTVWERWNGYTREKGYGPVGMNSFNHYAYGCVLEWLFSAAAGIRQAPGAAGWKHFVLAPLPDRRLGSVDARFVSPEGEITSSWRYEADGTLTWRFSIPEGTTATVSVPGGETRVFSPGAYSFKSNAAGAAERIDGLQARIDAQAKAGGGRVSVPAGEWKTGPIRLESGIELHLEEGARLVFPDDPSLYPVREVAFEGEVQRRRQPLVSAFGATNVSVTGKGTFEAKVGYWHSPGARKRGRPQFFHFANCRGVTLDGFRVRNSPNWTIHMFCTDDVTIRNLDVRCSGPNTDGIDLDSVQGALIENCRLDQGDDGFCMKSGRNAEGRRRARPTKNVTIRNCTVVNGHTLLGIGSELSGGVEDILLENCTVEGEVWRVLFVKTNPARGGYVRNVTVRNVKAARAKCSIFEIMPDYQWLGRDKPKGLEVVRTPIEDILVENVTCDEGWYAYELRGDPEMPPRGISIRNCEMRHPSRGGPTATNVVDLAVEGVRADPEPFSAWCDDPDSRYECGRTAVFHVKSALTSGVAHVRLDNFGTKALREFDVDLSERSEFSVEGTRDVPGFLLLTVTSGKVVKRWGAAFSPDRISAGADRPADFERFWRDAIARYDREVPSDVRLERLEALSSGGCDVYMVTLSGPGGEPYYGFLKEPSDLSRGPFPARVHVPGAGPSLGTPACGDRNTVGLTMNVHTYRPVVGALKRGAEHNALQKAEDDRLQKKYPALKPRYTVSGIAAGREEYFYYGAILAINRAVDWLRRRAEVKADDMTYGGGSQGGGMGLAVVALNGGFRNASISVPALTAHLCHLIDGRISGWPRLVEAQMPENVEAAKRNAPYFDGVNFASMITCPIVFKVGFVDTVAPPHAGYAAFNACPSKAKAMFDSVGFGHATSAVEGVRMRSWMLSADGDR